MEWRDIDAGYPFTGTHEVSENGDIRHKPGLPRDMRGSRNGNATLKWHIVRNGYAHVLLCRWGVSKDIMVHRAVATAFVPNPNNLPYVNHIDGNRLNNTAANLEWCTNSQNQLHSLYVLRTTKNTMPVLAYNKHTGALVYEFDSISRGAKWLIESGLARDTTAVSGIVKSCKGLIPSYHGFIWRYKESEPQETIAKASRAWSKRTPEAEGVLKTDEDIVRSYGMVNHAEKRQEKP